MRVNSLTPQDLKAYGINDVQDIVYNPSYDLLYQRNSILLWKVTSAAY